MNESSVILLCSRVFIWMTTEELHWDFVVHCTKTIKAFNYSFLFYSITHLLGIMILVLHPPGWQWFWFGTSEPLISCKSQEVILISKSHDIETRRKPNEQLVVKCWVPICELFSQFSIMYMYMSLLITVRNNLHRSVIMVMGHSAI